MLHLPGCCIPGVETSKELATKVFRYDYAFPLKQSPWIRDLRSRPSHYLGDDYQDEKVVGIVR